MPFGFPAYAERTERLKGHSAKALLRAAEDALETLGWHPRREDRCTLRASVPMGMHGIFVTFGARFRVEIEDDTCFIRSEGNFPLEWMDLGQHAENIRRFLDRVEDILEEDD